ncbi:MAG: hypothetical protein FWD48_03515 [Oscillospiraceae bacterium]|nr:hypothetical protein [Oscillospiraceae bacterium]
MKKLLSILLIFTMLVILTTLVDAGTPPPRIIFRDKEQLMKMREMVKASDEELEKYLDGYFKRNGLMNREDVVNFLNLLDSLPIPYNEDMRFGSLTYYPDPEIQTFDMIFSSKTGERHTFRLFTGEDKGKSLFEEDMGGEMFIEIYRGQDNGRQIIVYSPPSAWGSYPNRHGNYTFPMEIEGFFISAGYVPGQSDAYVTAEDIYRHMTVTTIRDLLWIERPELITTDDELVTVDELTTADALTVLRAVAGITSLTDAESVRFGISGAPTTADALAILRKVAGL